MDSVAVIGMGCRFPGARGLTEYWQLLREGTCAIREVPPDRWDAAAYYDADPSAPYKMVTRWGGFVDDVDQFDPAFWRIPPNEAKRMDPQHRILLEVTWEALEDAGLTRDGLAGSKTGVFVGLSAYDYGRMQSIGPVDAHSCYCCAFSIAANRLSYLFDWRGPSLTLDTACSSSLVALHLARESLLRGESSVALVAGVNLMLHPDLLVSLSKAGMMAPDGLCKPFDARANGYVRSDGIGVVVLKRLSHAERDGDRVYALVHGSAVNQDGRSNGLTAPNPKAQESVLREAYASAGIDPALVGYVEAHGTGTALGDAVEAKALSQVFAPGRPASDPLWLGSVKSNIGHTETAAGVASLIKTALALRAGEIPATLHHEQPNPNIDFEGLRLAVTTARRGYSAERPYVGISGFGYGGTNAHVVVGPAPARRVPAARREPQAELLVLSARSGEELAALAQRLLDSHLDGTRQLANLCATAALRRTHHEQRLAIVAGSPSEVRDALGAWSSGRLRPSDAAATAQRKPGAPVFVCSGNGGHWLGMGRFLLAHEPTFRETMRACDAALAEHEGWSLLAELERPDAESRLERPAIVQPIIAALQISLASFWQGAGIVPAAVVGHSMGEVAAAQIAGLLTLSDAMRVIGARARRLDEVAGLGGMLAIELDLEEALALCAASNGRVELAVENAPRSQVLSGDEEALREIAKRAESDGVWCRAVRVPVPYHSRAVDSILPKLLADLSGLTPRPPTLRFVSTVDPAAAEPTLDAAYWLQNVRQRVRFAEAIARLADDAHAIFLELGPHPLHAESIARTCAARQREVSVLASMRRADDGRRALLSSVGALWCRGANVRLERVVSSDAPVEPLPSYPFRRQRYWFDPQFSIGAAAVGHPLLVNRVELADAPQRRYFSGEVSAGPGSPFADHRLEGVPVLPGAAFCDALLHALGAGRAAAAEAVTFTRAVVLSEEAATGLQLRLSDVTAADCEITLYARRPGEVSWQRSAVARAAAPSLAPEPTSLEDLHARLGVPRPAAELYAGLAERGYDYGPAFRGLREFCANDREAIAVLAGSEDVQREVARYAVHPALLDAAFQLFGATVPAGAFAGKLLVPVRIERVECWLPGVLPRFAHVVQRSIDADGLSGDVTLLDAKGRAIAVLSGLTVASFSGTDAVRPEWFVGVRWDQTAAKPTAPRTGTWALLGAAAETAALRDALSHAGVTAEVWESVPERLPASLTAAVLIAPRANDRSEPSRSELSLATQALSLGQRLIKDEARARLFLVTHGAQAIASNEGAQATGSSLWGLGRTLAFEHPELEPTCIDVGPGAHVGLAAALVAADDEGQVALRSAGDAGVTRYVARLGRSPLPVPRPISGLERGTIIVTGGLGALGLRAARSLVNAGVRSLALWGRSAPSPAAREELARLEADGVRLLVQAVDVASAQDVERAIAEIEYSQAAVTGVVHCAGVVDNGLFTELDPANFERVFASKVTGACSIERALRGRPLKLFVLYGSVAGLVGSPGQANYAAGNAWLEGFAHTLRGQGIAATCIAWGAWSEVGLAAAEGRWAARIEGLGLLPISPLQGDAALSRLLLGAPAVVGVVPVDAARLRAVLGVRPPSLLRDLVEAKGSEPKEILRIDSLRELSAAERRLRIQRELSAVVGSMTGADPGSLDTRTLLGDLGIDSLLGLELRARLEASFGGKVPTAALMRQPTIEGIAELLAGSFESALEPAPAPGDVAPSERARSLWISRKPRAAEPALRLYCFHHAGGSVAVWHRWAEALPTGCEVCAIQLPGRDGRNQEPLSTDLSMLARDIARAIAGEADWPFALLGHSVGALLAFESARALRAEHGLTPAHLIVAALRAPEQARSKQPVRELSDAALLERLRGYGGLPEQIARAPELLALLMPRIRADLGLLDGYSFAADSPLDCPITVLGGQTDASVPASSLAAWSEHTRGPFARHELPGGHFFIEQQRAAAIALVKRVLFAEKPS